MVKHLRNLALDSRPYVRSARRVPKLRWTPLLRRLTPGERRDRVLDALGLIDKQRPDGMRLEELSKLAGHTVSTWHAWRRRENPTEPKYGDLIDFARVVGLDFQVTSQAAETAGISGAGARGAAMLEDEDLMQIAEVLAAMPASLRAKAVRAMIVAAAKVAGTEAAKGQASPQNGTADEKATPVSGPHPPTAS
jgi:hypothetical protein